MTSAKALAQNLFSFEVIWLLGVKIGNQPFFLFYFIIFFSIGLSGSNLKALRGKIVRDRREAFDGDLLGDPQPEKFP